MVETSRGGDWREGRVRRAEGHTGQKGEAAPLPSQGELQAEVQVGRKVMQAASKAGPARHGLSPPIRR